MSEFELKYRGEKINELLGKANTALQSVPAGYVTETELNEKGYLTEHQDISNLATKEELESKQDIIEDLDLIREEAGKVAEIVDEDGYLLSNGEKVDMRFTRSLLPVGKSIPAKANLNTKEYLKIGKYYCSLNADVKTITNCPVNVAFSMEVFNPLGTNVDDEDTKEYTYRMRVITQYDTGQQYMQFCRTSGTPGSWTYDSWYITTRAKFTLASSKNDGSAAVGSATQGAYVDSTGTLTKMTYTLAKSVPSNAVFTDTNTKVTAVENHYVPAEDESAQINAEEGECVVGIRRDAAGHVVGVVSSRCDIELSEKVDAIEQALNAMVEGDATSAIESFNEIIAFLEGVQDTESLDGIIASIEQQIAAKQSVIDDLATIRSGAALGATALQSVPANYATTEYVDDRIADAISSSIMITLNTPV